MIDTLVKGLRGELTECNCCAYSSAECCCDTVWPEDVASEAADRIEQLEAQNAMQLAAHEYTKEQLAAAQADNARLREALRWVLNEETPDSVDNAYSLLHQHTDDSFTCNWWEGDDGGPWATQCNELFNIEEDGPDANGMKFCCFCGKKLNEVRAESEEEDEDT